jgi:P27 family predicted phage terminase small subunit
LEGNPGKRNRGESPQPKKGAPKPPHFLSGEALAEWGRIVPELESIGLLSVVDRSALTAYCEAWATFVSATEDIHERGTMVRGRDGNAVKNPAVAMQRDALQQIKVWVTEFGLTPSARSRMQLPSEKPAGEDASVANLFAV